MAKARLWGNAGELVRFLKSDAEYSSHGDPVVFDTLFEFDTDTNPDIVNGLDTDWNSHSFVDGILNRNGLEVTVNPPGTNYLADDIEKGSLAQAQNIPGWATWTEAQALDWHDTNIKDPLATVPDIDGLTAQQFQANAQDIMALWQDVLDDIESENRALARLVVAMRNKTWPNLEAGG